MVIKMNLCLSACSILLLWIIMPNSCHSLAVMSVDLGSEWMKVGIVSPGVPMEIALNKESKRKSPAVLSFSSREGDNTRIFGEDAQTLGLRYPKTTYMYLLDLLGKKIDHPLVELYKKRFPYYDLVGDEERDGAVKFRHNGDEFYSPEELVAQMLGKAKEFAEQGARQTIKECVLTVPGYFNQVERRALLQAAQLADLKVLQLINDYTAVALNYGIFRSKDFNETAQYVMFYDMGATSTTATLVSYQTVKTKERGYVETHPQLSIMGVGFDRTLGGLEIQLRLRDHLAQRFNQVKKTKSDVYQNERALAKLFKEAGRLKNVLSANAEHYAQIEGLLDEEDFKVLVTREQMEQLIPDLLERVARPVEQALGSAHLTPDILSQIVLVGAGTRVPKIQEVLQEALDGRYLAKNLNTDEAACMGAVYKAADLSTGFQVKKFITKDAVLYPVQIVFERRSIDDSLDDQTPKQIKRTLFGLMNPYPQKKIITFNKHTQDFSFGVNYADLDQYLPEGEIRNVGSLNLSVVRLEGVAEAIGKLRLDVSSENVENKGIKAHFQMDESGLLNLVNVELVAEKTVDENEEEDKAGTLSKLGSTISKLFHGDVDTNNETVGNSSASGVNATEDHGKVNDTDQQDKPKVVPKPKVVTVKEVIKSEVKVVSQPLLLDQKQYDTASAKIAKLDKIEHEINRRATALNTLESFVIEVRNKLYEDDYKSSSTDDEIDKITKSCDEISDWIYEDGSEADAETYEQKLKSLKQLTHDLFARVWEHSERPEALGALVQMLNHSRGFLDSARNLTKATNPDKDVFTESEVEALEKLIDETEQWKVKMVKSQSELKNFEAIKLTVRSMTDKMAALDREVKYLVNKIKLWRPKKAPEKPVKEENVESDNRTSEDGVVDDENEPEEVVEEIVPSKSDDEDAKHTEL